ncbi:MAG: sulfatase, partial [Planctomycetaceae bacterium]|nr:sulfatase [Planctomycetaceae bacterium]
YYRFALAFLLAIAGLHSSCPGQETERPNFIVISIDDLGYADIGAFGSTLNQTPHIDRMAAEGRKFTCFYAAPVCSPSRSALMTGCYPKRVLPIPGVLFPGAAVGVNPEEVTVAEVLKSAGYKTACIGKWHLGDQAAFLPTAQGFDYYLGIPYSNDMGTAAEGSKSDLGAPIPQPAKGSEKQAAAAPSTTDETGLRGNQQPSLPLVENTRVIGTVAQDQQQAIVETYTNAAVKFLKENKDERFFLYLPHNAVHFPLYPGKNWVGKSGNGLYSDWIAEVDDSVGTILNTVRELGIDRRTLILFTSDNGGTPRAVNKPLRGFKGSTWEGGMRVPTIVWWPGVIPGGTQSDAITGMMDVLPTFAGLSGAKLDETRRIDGMDLSKLLRGEAGAAGHDTFYYYHGLNLQAVRKGAWKLIPGTPAANAQGNAAAKQESNSKAAAKTEAGTPKKNSGKNVGNKNANKKNAAKTETPVGPQLYNLESDVAESMNVADAHPEIVAELMKLAEQMDDDLGRSGRGPGVRSLGRVANPEPFIRVDGTVREDAR